MPNHVDGLYKTNGKRHFVGDAEDTADLFLGFRETGKDPNVLYSLLYCALHLSEKEQIIGSPIYSPL
jgi:hypothetical protein